MFKETTTRTDCLNRTRRWTRFIDGDCFIMVIQHLSQSGYKDTKTIITIDGERLISTGDHREELKNVQREHLICWHYAHGEVII